MRKKLQFCSAVLAVFAALNTFSAFPAFAESAPANEPFEILETESYGAFDVYHIRLNEAPTLPRKPNLLAKGSTNALGLTDYQMESLKKDIHDAIAKKETIIDISSYYIPYDLEMSDLFISLIGEDPDNISADVNGYYSIDVNDKKYFYGIWVEYFSDKAVAEMKSAADRLLEGIDSSALNDAEKALILHDRLAVQCEYDVVHAKEGNVPDESYQAYGALVNKVAVCEGYSKAYMYLMNRLGIHTELIDSHTLNHAWNIVTIDGKRYHVDVTHDDPTPDLLGRVKHNHFLLSTDALTTVGKYTVIDFDTTPTATNYESAPWITVNTNFVLHDDSIYYIAEDGTLNSLKNEASSTLLKLSEECADTRWYADSSGSYWKSFYGMLSCDDDALYFNLAKHIYRYIPEDNSVSVFYTPAETSAALEQSIYRFRALDGYFDYVISNNPNQINTVPIQHMDYRAFFTQVSATLRGDIGMNFCMQLTDDAMNDDAYMEFTVDGLDGDTTKIALSDLTPEADGSYRFTCHVNALQMADTITAVYHYGDNQTVTAQTSVKDYILSVVELAAKGNADCIKAKPLVQALADYGYFAQKSLAAAHGFSIGTDHAAMIHFNSNPDTTADLSAYAYTQSGDAESIGAEKITKTLALDSKTDIIVFFTMQDGKALTAEDIQCDATYPTSFSRMEDGRYCFMISDIDAAELEKTFHISVKDDAWTLDLSALSYANAILSGDASAADKNTCAALYAYYLAAENY